MEEGPEKSLEEGAKQGQHPELYEVARTVQSADYWDSAERLRHTVIENWNRGKTGFHVHFGISAIARTEMETGEYCARFEPPPKCRLAKHSSGSRYCDFHLRLLSVRRRGRKCAMLVPIVDFLDVTKEGRVWPLPAVVWLQPLNKCLHFAGDARHLVTHAAEISSERHKRELDLSLLSWRRGLGEKPHQMVECGPEIVSGIANQQAHLVRHGIDMSNDDLQPMLAIRLMANAVETRHSGLGNGIQLLEVLMGLPDLQSDRVERVSHVLGPCSSQAASVA
jgi:hypothetical protein